MQEWATNETNRMSLKDKRRNDRMAMLLEAITESPASSISQACHGLNAETKGAYRLIGTTEIDEQDMLEGHYKATMQRALEHEGRVIIVGDGMDASFTNLKKTKGLGTLSNGKDSLGIKAQNTFVFSKNYIPLGLVSQQYWVRNKEDYGKKRARQNLPIEQKESYQWVKGINQIEKNLPLEKGYVFIGDGGADIYDVFLTKRRNDGDLLIHLTQNRGVKGEDLRLFQLLAKEPILGFITKKLERTKTHTERTVKLAIQVKDVEMEAPTRRKKEMLPTIKITAVFAQEIESDKSTNDPIIWRLATTIGIKSLEDAEKLIDLYSKRWLIERYHYILKEGCRIEKLQMESADNLKRALAIYSIAAWRLMYITYIARINPNAPFDLVLTPDEMNALYCIHNKTPVPSSQPISVKEATMMLAKLGGFLGRKGDGEPGAKVLWQGLFRLEAITQAYLVFKPLNVGNG